MALQPAKSPKSKAQLSTGTLIDDDPGKISRHMSELADTVARQGDGQTTRVVLTVDLAIGANRISHGLGRAARGATVTPTVADATWAWSFAADGDRIAVITTVGVVQPKATIEVY